MVDMKESGCGHCITGFLSCLIALILVLIGRIYWVLIRKKGYRPEKVTKNVKTMIVAGSGKVSDLYNNNCHYIISLY